MTGVGSELGTKIAGMARQALKGALLLSALLALGLLIYSTLRRLS